MDKLSYTTYDNVKMPIDLYLPTGGSASGLVIYYFGGGWNGGTITQFSHQALELSRLGLAVALPEYRVYSRHSTTAEVAVKDAIYSAEHIYKVADDYGINKKNLAIGGGSAGGHLALCTAMLSEFIPPHFSYYKNISALILCNPVTDTVEFGSAPIENSLYDAQMLSPMHNIKTGLPDAVLFHGTDDKLVSFNSALRFCEQYNAAGNRCTIFEYEGKPHGFFNLGKDTIENYYSVLGRTVKFLNDKKFINL